MIEQHDAQINVERVNSPGFAFTYSADVLLSDNQSWQFSSMGSSSNKKTEIDNSIIFSLCKRELSSSEKAFIERFFDVIHQNYRHDSFNRKKASELMGMCGRHLNRKLSDLLVYNFNRYLKHHRLQCSLTLLNQGLQVAQIADRVGFANATYFSTCFKAEFNMTVRAFEKQIRTKD